MKEDIINKLIEDNNYKSYLEIGVDVAHNIERIKCVDKTGVDPVRPPVIIGFNFFEMTSDKFFNINEKCYDIIFVDGLHTYEQAIKDFSNAKKVLNAGGVIVMHDMNPPSEKVATPAKNYSSIKGFTSAWTGDVWKVLKQLWDNKDDGLYFRVCSEDWGVAIISLHDNHKEYFPEKKYSDLLFKDFLKLKEEIGYEKS